MESNFPPPEITILGASTYPYPESSINILSIFPSLKLKSKTASLKSIGFFGSV